MEVESFTVPLGEAAMDAIRFGGGDRALVMIPGLNLHRLRETGYALAHTYKRFADDYTVYIFDRRDPVREGYSVRDIAADTAAGMDALGIGSAAVFGVSQGGMAAMYLALDRPELVEKLVLAVTAARANDTLRQVVGRWSALAEADDYDGLVADVMEKMYSPEYLRRFGRLLPAVSRVGRPDDLYRLSVLTRSCLTCEAYDRLGEIRCPAFVIGGRRDKVLTGEASVEIAEKLGCGIYLYEDLGHSAYEEARDFNDRVLAFLRHG